ncbi:hypothetical protein TNCV_362271 [Trichonephila clavipes]|nr:hypothetical protein TNCV_362271 [Trichonephila clavipes]
MLEKVIENWTSRSDYIRASRGSPMPEIIFKMCHLSTRQRLSTYCVTLQKCLQRCDVHLWPARSPDLSPIEYVWDVLGGKLQSSQNIGESGTQLQRLRDDLTQEV